jgi:hypothetical protein
MTNGKPVFMKHIRMAAALALSLFICQGIARAQSRGIINIDSPTAFTIGRGNYQVSLLEYDNGGMELKTIIGLHDILYLGVSLDVQNAIGKDDPKPNVPGVIARLKFTDGWEEWPISIAIGYDSFFIGEQGKRENVHNPLDRMIYGPYLAVTKPIYLFDDEQYLSYGLRVPAQPEYVPEDTSYYVALDIPLGQMFRIKGEIERVYWNFRDSEEWLYNAGLRYTYLDQLGIEFDFLFQPHERGNRILRIEYHDHF